MTYFIAALPRSRTAWFSAYLTALGSLCAHEALNGCGKKEDFNDRMALVEGNSDCGLVLTDFQSRFPESRTVIIHRPVSEVLRSLEAINLPVPASTLFALSHKLKSLSGLHVRFNEIDLRLKEITDYLGVRYDEAITRVFTDMNITTKNLVGSVESFEIWEDVCLG